jgi:3-oxoacyl-[acyl-carrier-protein] synthase-3
LNFSILGTGSVLPEFVVTNDDLSKFLDTNDEWITTRTGIKRRHILTDRTLTQIGAEAAKKALEESGTKPEELDLILCTTTRGDYITPALACTIQAELGAACPAYDISAACSGFIFALDCAIGYFARGTAKRILIVSAESMSRITDWTDRSTCVLFGDGAGAAVLGPGEDCLSMIVTTKGTADILNIPHVEGNCPYQEREGKQPFVNMNGQEVFKLAVNSIFRDLKDAVKKAGTTLGDISHFVMHQANYRILETVCKRLGIDSAKVPLCIEDTGNMSSATVPVLLDIANRSGRLKKGDLVAMCGFGAGFTTGACVIRWAI